MKLQHQVLPYWVLSKAHEVLRAEESKLTKNLNQSWIDAFKDKSVEEIMETGGHVCGDPWLRTHTVRKFVERALYEQDDAIKEELENGTQR